MNISKNPIFYLASLFLSFSMLTGCGPMISQQAGSPPSNNSSLLSSPAPTQTSAVATASTASNAASNMPTNAGPNTIAINTIDGCQGSGNDCLYDTDENRNDLQNAVASALTARGAQVVPGGHGVRTLTLTVTTFGNNESDMVSDLCGALCDAASSDIAAVNYQITNAAGEVVYSNSANASVPDAVTFTLDPLFQQLSGIIAASLNVSGNAAAPASTAAAVQK